jgi:ABC-2 type transport system ATP-binding protein
MAEMQQTADRVVVIGAGELLGQFDIGDLEAGTSLEDAYLRLTAGAVQHRAGSEERN